MFFSSIQDNLDQGFSIGGLRPQGRSQDGSKGVAREGDKYK